MRFRRTAALLVTLGAFLLSRLASAQPDGSLAETLFQEGKTLLAQGAFAQACPKLAESQRLDPGDGTLLALAVCHEGEGKLAAAWSEFTAVANRADARSDRVQRAKERLADLEPRLARVAVVVPEATAKGAPGVEIARDGNVLDRAAWGAASPVDPGAHIVTANAPGKKPVRLEVVAARGRTVEVVVSALEDERGGTAPVELRVAPPTEVVSDTPRSTGKIMRITGVTLGAVGVVAIGIGGYFGLRAVSLSNEARSECDDAGCSAESLQKNDDARSAAQIANITVVGGLAAVGGGILLYVLAPKALQRTAISPYAGPGTAGASFHRVF